MFKIVVCYSGFYSANLYYCKSLYPKPAYYEALLSGLIKKEGIQ